MSDSIPEMTLAEFDIWANQDERGDFIYEWIGGKVVQWEPANYAAMLSARITVRLGKFVEENNLGYITGKRGGFAIAGERYHPSIAYTSKARLPELPRENGYLSVPPELVVELDAHNTSEFQQNLRIKLFNYLSVGTTVWIVLPEAERIEVYVPGNSPQILGLDGILTCEHILPGFQLPVKEIFPRRENGE